MAEVYKEIDGEKIQRLIARTGSVQAELNRQSWKVYAKAARKLAGHQQTGNAHLGIERGDIDRYVYLSDPPSASSPGGAASIEYGHFLGKRGSANRQYIEGLYVLHDAAGLHRQLKLW